MSFFSIITSASKPRYTLTPVSGDVWNDSETWNDNNTWID